MSETNRIFVREMDPEDYTELFKYWNRHGWDAPPISALPVPYYVAIKDNKIVAGEGLLISKYNGLAMQEWLVSDPEANPRDVIKSIKALDAHIEEVAREEGTWAVLSFCKQESLAKIKQKLGFVRTDDSMIHLLKPIN